MAYDTIGNYIPIIESFNNPTLNNNCVDNIYYKCPEYANNYKSCFIDGKNKNCCKTCEAHKTCTDTNSLCTDWVNNKLYIKDNGLCKDSTWNQCCASCNNKLNNKNNQNSNCKDILPICSNYSNYCNHNNALGSLLKSYLCCKTCNKSLTSTDNIPCTDLSSDCYKNLPLCSQNSFDGTVMRKKCCQTCNSLLKT